MRISRVFNFLGLVGIVAVCAVAVVLALGAAAASAAATSSPAARPASGPDSAQTDFHVIGSLAVEPAPEWGRKAESLMISREWWFNRTQMVFITQGWRYVFDKGRSRILVINAADGYYIEVSMLADTRDLVDPEYAATLGRVRASGTVSKSPNKRTALERECNTTAISEWLVDDGQHVFDRDRTVYATTDVPFDWRMYRDLTTWMVSFFSPDMAYFGGLRSIEGFPMVETDISVRSGRSTNYGVEIKHIYAETPPQEIYEIPEGLGRREKLGRRDIQAIRQIIYLAYYF